MSDVNITFTIRYEQSLCILNIETPSDVNRFAEKLKEKLNLEDNKILILYPLPDGKMKTMTTDDDIEFLKETKLCYNAIGKQLYCSVELVVIIIRNQQENDPIAQLKGLTKKVDQLSSKFDEYFLDFNNKLEEHLSNILESIRSITLSEQSMENSGNASIKKSIGTESYEKNKPNASVGKGHMKPPKKVKKDLEKLQVTTNNDFANRFLKSNEQNIPGSFNNMQEINNLLKKLVDEGFNDNVQNILALKKFSNNYEKALNYLKSKEF